MKHLLTLMDLSPKEISGLLDLAAKFKKDPLGERKSLRGRTLAMIFQKPSTRTRVSFEVAMQRLGGNALFLSSRDLQLGRGETIADTARVLARYCDAIMARVFNHADLTGLAEGGVPVINGLSDLLHPCQALADAMTIRERKGSLNEVKLAYLGDGNNVANALITLAARTGLALRIACPSGYDPDPDIVHAARHEGADLLVTADPREAVAGVDVVYTDTWTSMGQEDDADRRRRDLTPYRVDEALFAAADPDALFMHCLPAHRGSEVVNAVIDHDRSVVFDQAENRLHTEQAVLFTLLAA
jgi:ornithine carbamoyltransferase